MHYWRDKASKVWRQARTPFLERSARGDIAVDAKDNLYVVSADFSTRKPHVQTASKASGWTIRYTSPAIIFVFVAGPDVVGSRAGIAWHGIPKVALVVPVTCVDSPRR